MNGYRRRAYSLITLLALLPLIGAVGTSAWMLAARTMKVQAQERDVFLSDASWRDLVRRVQADGLGAELAGVGEDGGSLTFQRADGIIRYDAQGERVLRSDRTPSAGAQTFDWPALRIRAVFRVESISGQNRIVWITFARQVRAEAGPPRETTWSVAAAVGPGRWP